MILIQFEIKKVFSVLFFHSFTFPLSYLNPTILYGLIKLRHLQTFLRFIVKSLHKMKPQYLVLLAVLAISNLTYGEKCHVPGRCSGGSLVSVGVVTSEIECLTECRNDPDCFWISYHDDDLHFCEKYYNCTEVVSDHCNNCFTSQSSCKLEPDPICFISGACLVSLNIPKFNWNLIENFQGDIVSTLTTDSSIECLEKSRSENSSWFSFDTVHSICVTYKNCPSINEELNSYLSGQSSCPIKGKP